MAFWKSKNKFPESKHIIEPAFTVGGIQYYCFKDIFNLPYKRALQALVYYREVSLNIDREYIEMHIQAVRNALTPTANKKIIDVNAAYAMNEQLAQRLKLPPDVDMLYKLAAIVYFDANEKPENYEFDYGAKKIEFWKKHKSVEDFFLQTPLQELIPFLKEAGKNLNTYQEMIKETKKKHLEKVLSHLSEPQKTTLPTK